MAKIKLTKNELKKQKDELKMFQRYIPMLTLKKQQLQMEIRLVDGRIKALDERRALLITAFSAWIAVFAEEAIFRPDSLQIIKVQTGLGNVAGVEIQLFEGVEFSVADYDLFTTPLWLDAALEQTQALAQLDLESAVLADQKSRLEHELRITTQRVNLFEKVKIPEAKANIKRIAVYLGDQQTAAVVRGKIAKQAMARVES